jgi:opacity protein-like surface antigen
MSMPFHTRFLAVVMVVALPSSVRAQARGWKPEVSLGAGIAHVFRWEDKTYGNPANVGGGFGIAHSSGWAIEVHGDRTFGLAPLQAPCGLVNVTCVGVAHYGPTVMSVASINARYQFNGRRLEPYLLGGLGILFSRSLHSMTHVSGPIAVMTETQSSDRGFGPELGAGVRLPVARGWSLNGELRWLDAPWLSRQNLATTRVNAHVTYTVGRAN